MRTAVAVSHAATVAIGADVAAFPAVRVVVLQVKACRTAAFGTTAGTLFTHFSWIALGATGSAVLHIAQRVDACLAADLLPVGADA